MDKKKEVTYTEALEALGHFAWPVADLLNAVAALSGTADKITGKTGGIHGYVQVVEASLSPDGDRAAKAQALVDSLKALRDYVRDFSRQIPDYAGDVIRAAAAYVDDLPGGND